MRTSTLLSFLPLLGAGTVMAVEDDDGVVELMAAAYI
jgi:hypothetical protein